MAVMACIVLTTDLSDAARTAARPALELARALHCELRVLHVVHSPVLAPALTASVDLDRADAEAALAAFCASLRAEVAVHPEVRLATEVVAAIDAYARDTRARYVVTAASGKSGWQRMRLGSVSSALVHRACVPVVVVPSPDATGARPLGQAIAVAIEGSATASRAIPAGVELASACHAPLALVGVYRAQDAAALHDSLARAAASLHGHGFDVRSVALPGDDVAVTLAQWAATQAAYVCLAPGEKSLRRFVFGSTVDAILQQLRVPGIVVPPDAA